MTLNYRHSNHGMFGQAMFLIGLAMLIAFYGVITHNDQAFEHDLKTVMPLPSFITPMVRADGTVSSTFPPDLLASQMPSCEEYGFEECVWDAHVITKPGTLDDMILDVQLKVDGREVGRTQLLRVNTADYEQLAQLQEAGYDKGWIGHVQVAKNMRGNGLGRIMWKAGDTVLRLASGPAAVRIIYDTAGWGHKLMADIEHYLIEDAPLWAYFVSEIG